jgi:hypothetical protein
MEQWRVRRSHRPQLGPELTQRRCAGEQGAADQGNPATSVLAPVSSQPVVLPAPVDLAPLRALHDRWSKHGAESGHEGIAPDVSGGGVEHLPRRGEALILEEVPDRQHERFDVSLTPWCLRPRVEDGAPSREHGRRTPLELTRQPLDDRFSRNFCPLGDGAEIGEEGIECDERLA